MSKSQDLVSRTERWLIKPNATDIPNSLSESNELLRELNNEIQKGGVSKKDIGTLIGQVKGMQKRIQNIETMDWVSVGGGSVSIGHRPGSKLITDLKLQNTTHILTLLSEQEGGKEVGNQSKKAGIGWLWFPMESANPPGKDRNNEIAVLFSTMEETLKERGNIYIHCSAGIHRTGMITYAFLRFTGLDESTSKKKLKELRETTSEGAGVERLRWGDTLSSQLNE